MHKQSKQWRPRSKFSNHKDFLGEEESSTKTVNFSQPSRLQRIRSYRHRSLLVVCIQELYQLNNKCYFTYSSNNNRNKNKMYFGSLWEKLHEFRHQVFVVAILWTEVLGENSNVLVSTSTIFASIFEVSKNLQIVSLRKRKVGAVFLLVICG